MAPSSRWKLRVANIEGNPGFASLTQATLAALWRQANMLSLAYAFSLAQCLSC